MKDYKKVFKNLADMQEICVENCLSNNKCQDAYRFKRESTLNFYRNALYNSDDKTAFIQWL